MKGQVEGGATKSESTEGRRLKRQQEERRCCHKATGHPSIHTVAAVLKQPQATLQNLLQCQCACVCVCMRLDTLAWFNKPKRAVSEKILSVCFCMMENRDILRTGIKRGLSSPHPENSK